MPDVIETEEILLRPGDAGVPYEFHAPPASAAGENDGAIPYGYSISSIQVFAYDVKGVDKTSELIYNSQVAQNIITVQLNYPSVSGTGKYLLKFLCTLNTGITITFLADKIRAEGY